MYYRRAAFCCAFFVGNITTMPDPMQTEQPRREFKNYSGNFLKHPPYNPDFAPSDFHLFGPLKYHLGGKRFADDEEVETEVRKLLRQQSKDLYAVGFDALVKQWDMCIKVGGGYVENIFFSGSDITCFTFYIHL
jgi:hypothetical protein